MTFLQATLNAIPAAASSPLALIAYCISIVAWVIISYRVIRNKQLLQKIDKFPENERRIIVISEMGMPPEGITVEAWIKSKTQTNILIGLTLILLTLAFVFFIAMHNREYTPTGDITLAVGIDRELESYDSIIDKNGILIITPKSEYLDKLTSNKITQPSDWKSLELPKLSIKISNNSKRKIVISEIQLDILNARTDLNPVLRASDWGDEKLQIYNAGWGEIHNPELVVGITDIEKCSPENFLPNKHVEMSKSDDAYLINLKNLVPKEYKEKVNKCELMDIKQQKDIKKSKKSHTFFLPSSCDDIQVCVFGTMNYVANQDYKTWKFMQDITLYKKNTRINSGAFLFTTHIYRTSLQSDEKKYIKSVPVQQDIAVNETDNFELEIQTERSSYIELVASIISSEFGIIASKKIHIHTFTERY